MALVVVATALGVSVAAAGWWLATKDEPVVTSVASGHAFPTPEPTGDPDGRAACLQMRGWVAARMPAISEYLVETIHGYAIKSTNANIVHRGTELYDKFQATALAKRRGELSDAEVRLRMLTPMIEFDTACAEAGYHPV